MRSNVYGLIEIKAYWFSQNVLFCTRLYFLNIKKSFLNDIECTRYSIEEVEQ